MSREVRDADGTPRPVRSKAPPVVKGVLGFFLLLGGTLVIAALLLAVREWRFIVGSDHAIAIVSRVDQAWMQGSRSGGGNRGYRVIATFADADGRSVEVRSPSVTSYTGYRVGDPIGVDYPPGRPDRAQFARFTDRWTLQLVLGGIGIVAVAIAGLAMWLLRQPGTRITTNGMGGFTIRSAGYAIDDGAPEPAAPPTLQPVANPVVERRPTWHWLAIMLCLGVAIGLAIARTDDRRDSTNTPAPGYPPNLVVNVPDASADNGTGPAAR